MQGVGLTKSEGSEARKVVRSVDDKWFWTCLLLKVSKARDVVIAGWVL